MTSATSFAAPTRLAARISRSHSWLCLAAIVSSTLLMGSSIAQEPARLRAGSTPTESFLCSERDLWQLENLLLHEALFAVRSSELDLRSPEMSFRKAIRRARSPETLRRVRNFMDDYLQRQSRDLLTEIARDRGVTAEEVFADYLTVEATIDFSLMASAYNTVKGNNFAKFPADAQRLLTRLTENLTKPPVPSDKIEIGRVDRYKLVVNVFGCSVNEEVLEVRDLGRDSAELTWRSNYSFLRDLKDRKVPQDARKEMMLREGERWLIAYDSELEEFIDVTGRGEWGRKVRELLDVDGYLSRKDPLDDQKNRRTRYQYDPEESSESVSRFTGLEEQENRGGRTTTGRRDPFEREDDRNRRDPFEK